MDRTTFLSRFNLNSNNIKRWVGKSLRMRLITHERKKVESIHSQFRRDAAPLGIIRYQQMLIAQRRCRTFENDALMYCILQP